MAIKNEGASIRPARQLNELPGPPGLPWLGNLVWLFPKRIHLQLEAWARRYGDLYLFHLGPRPVLVVAQVLHGALIGLDAGEFQPGRGVVGFGNLQRRCRRVNLARSLQPVGEERL